MATEKRLIDVNALKKAILAEPWKGQPNTVRLTVDYINIIVDEQPTVDAVEVSRLGELGKMMIPYIGCPRGMIGPRGEDGEAKNRKFEILELDPITDIDGNRWVPVLDRDLSTLKDKAQNIVEVVHGRWEWLGPNRLVPECMCGTCSVCKVRSKYIVNTDICPNCGAKMYGK